MVVAAAGEPRAIHAAPRTSRTTPRIIEIVAILMALLILATFITSNSAITQTRNALLQVGYTAKPSVVVAEKLNVALADMDAAITNSSLGSRKSWWHYISDADTAVAMAVEASRNLGPNAPETESLRRVLSRLRTYYQFVGGSNAISTEDGADQKLPLTMTLWASHGLRQDIIPEVENLAKIANANLENAYSEYQANAGAAIIMAMVPAGLLLSLFLGVQFFLTRRTHRLVNVPLVFGTALLTFFMAWFIFVSLSDSRLLHVAKEDSFSTILHLYRAKVTSYLMKADESMWLFEQRRARSDYAQSFANGSRTILDIGNASQLALADPDRPTVPIDQAAIERLKRDLEEAERLAKAGQEDQADKRTPRDKYGYLGEELAHLQLHPDERKAATDAVNFFLRHIDIDTRIRTLEAAGHHTEAVRLTIGDNEGGSNWAFQGMNAAIDEIIKLNETKFDANIGAASVHVLRMMQALAVTLIGVVLLGGLGLWQRYAEYR